MFSVSPPTLHHFVRAKVVRRQAHMGPSDGALTGTVGLTTAMITIGGKVGRQKENRHMCANGGPHDAAWPLVLAKAKAPRHRVAMVACTTRTRSGRALERPAHRVPKRQAWLGARLLCVFFVVLLAQPDSRLCIGGGCCGQSVWRQVQPPGEDSSAATQRDREMQLST